MKRIAGFVLIVLSLTSFVIATPCGPVGPCVPEIDPGSAVNAAGLLLGAVLMVRRRKQ
jgi:uncharacterized protein (TIGR03382 family)